MERSERVEQFKAEIADMGVKDPSAARDRLLLRASVALLAVGPVLGIIAYFMSHGTENPLQQRDAIVLALIGVACSVSGGALFVRYALASFMRFWLARLCWEQQAQTDRVVAALDNRGTGTSVDARGTVVPTP
ncbi:MAG: hypothetical protein K0R11_566 [Acidimicrobiales bacterium]|jgi:hypothetical protein|nr:hypothetical protein [Acidimicrobiales bacterium]